MKPIMLALAGVLAVIGIGLACYQKGRDDQMKQMALETERMKAQVRRAQRDAEFMRARAEETIISAEEALVEAYEAAGQVPRLYVITGGKPN